MSAEAFLWIKAFHIISVISWMAGMLYLPRIYVYHTQVDPGSSASWMFQVMERKLLRYIINPAMIATYVFGIWLMSYLDWKHEGWLHAKIGLVLILSAFHGLLAKWRKDFERDANKRSVKFYKIVNEVPTILMIGIVILVVVKPF